MTPPYRGHPHLAHVDMAHPLLQTPGKSYPIKIPNNFSSNQNRCLTPGCTCEVTTVSIECNHVGLCNVCGKTTPKTKDTVSTVQESRYHVDIGVR